MDYQKGWVLLLTVQSSTMWAGEVTEHRRLFTSVGTRHWRGEVCLRCKGMFRFRKYEFRSVMCRGLSCHNWRDPPAQVFCFLFLLLSPLSSSCAFLLLGHATTTMSLLHPIHSVSIFATKLLFSFILFSPSISFHPASVLSTSVSSDLSL